MVFWSEGTDMLNGLTHSLVTTAANAHDVTQVSRLRKKWQLSSETWCSRMDVLNLQKLCQQSVFHTIHI